MKEDYPAVIGQVQSEEATEEQAAEEAARAAPACPRAKGGSLTQA